MAHAKAALEQELLDVERKVGTFDSDAYAASLNSYEARLVQALKKRGATKPHMRKIRLSVFGFSRGAAAARAWVNLVTNQWGSSLAGIPLQIDFLGIFDTVASVGIAQSAPLFNGHAAWADDRFLEIPGSVKRCVHLVAALEVRGSFALDSVCQGEMLPSNCKEIAYPGVHSDVGGGYPPTIRAARLEKGRPAISSNFRRYRWRRCIARRAWPVCHWRRKKVCCLTRS